ncbi:hypothetical protein PMAYCL1PPCAC_01519, partial [Pristionchus mayeri]
PTDDFGEFTQEEPDLNVRTSDASNGIKDETLEIKNEPIYDWKQGEPIFDTFNPTTGNSRRIGLIYRIDEYIDLSCSS